MSSSSLVETLLKDLGDDRRKPFPRYPSQARSALKDPTISNAVEECLQSGLVLNNIEALPLDVMTGLNRLVFHFSPLKAPDLKGHDLLVLLDSKSKVIGHVQGFSSEQPNPHLPANLEQETPLVMALSRDNESLLETGRVDEARSEAVNFLQNRFPGLFGGGLPGGVGGGQVGSLCDPPAVGSMCQISSGATGTIVKFLTPTRALWKRDEVMEDVEDDCELAE